MHGMGAGTYPGGSVMWPQKAVCSQGNLCCGPGRLWVHKETWCGYGCCVHSESWLHGQKSSHRGMVAGTLPVSMSEGSFGMDRDSCVYQR